MCLKQRLQKPLSLDRLLLWEAHECRVNKPKVAVVGTAGPTEKKGYPRAGSLQSRDVGARPF